MVVVVDEPRGHAPGGGSRFAAGKHASCSGRYKYFPTIEVLRVRSWG